MENWTQATTYGGLLKEYRLTTGLTQAELARRSALSVRCIQHLESGETRPYRYTHERLIAALRLSGEDSARFEALAVPKPRRRPPTVNVSWPTESMTPESLETADHTARLLVLAQWGHSLLSELSAFLDQHGLTTHPHSQYGHNFGRSATG